MSDLRKQVFRSTHPGPSSAHMSILEEPGPESPSTSASETGTSSMFAMPAPGRALPKPTTWDKYFDEEVQLELPHRGGKFNIYKAGSSGPVVYCMHGGGYTGVTWALVAAKLKSKYRVVAPDLRGHGKTTTDNDIDFSKETMSEDILAIWEALFGDSQERVPTVIVGHSMGGGLAGWAAASKRIKSLDGLVIIDVVEGTALAALPHMMGILNSRPRSFTSVEEGIKWATRSGTCKCKEAACVSMPTQLRQEPGGSWVWRTPLDKSRDFWEGWYTGLSEEFLKIPGPKMLLLAGTDRLDKVLTIGQMQGKFQLVLMPTAGHAIHEDEAEKTAEHLLQFLKRFRIGEPPLQFPKAGAGVRPVLPIVAGPLHQPQ